MWKLLKAQVSYNKMILNFCLLITLAVIIAFLTQGWKVPEMSYPALRAVLFAMTAIVFFSSLLKDVKEKRDRFFHVLPCNLWELGAARLIFVLMFWFSLILLVCFSFMIRNSIFNYSYLWDLLSQTGFILFMVGVIFFIRDIVSVFNFEKKKIIMVALNLFIVISIYILFMLFVVSKNALEISPSLITVKIHRV